MYLVIISRSPLLGLIASRPQAAGMSGSAKARGSNNKRPDSTQTSREPSRQVSKPNKHSQKLKGALPINHLVQWLSLPKDDGSFPRTSLLFLGTSTVCDQ